jgi:Uma2 family endonuclease
MSVEIAKYSFTAEEFERLGEAGILRQDARLELIEGEIFEMSPIGSLHAACVDALTLLLIEIARRRFIVRVQSSVLLNDFSEPQPDVTLLRWRDDFYSGALPKPEDVLLVIEVADTTVVKDRTMKIPLYARSGVPEAWLVNIPEEQVDIYSDPMNGSYQRVEVFGRGGEARSHTVEGLAVKVSEILR